MKKFIKKFNKNWDVVLLFSVIFGSSIYLYQRELKKELLKISAKELNEDLN